MRQTMLEGAEVDGFVHLFNQGTKRNLEKYCRTFVVRSKDFTALILGARAGVLDPYRYASRFWQWTPPHLEPTEDNLDALSENGVGPLKGRARKTMSKVFQIFEERRSFAAHLFYTPDHSYWYLFYFDQRDQATKNNHWEHGPHIHLVSSHWPNLALADVWQRVGSGNLDFSNKIHLRYLPEADGSSCFPPPAAPATFHPK